MLARFGVIVLLSGYDILGIELLLSSCQYGLGPSIQYHGTPY
jgi:hypothetical protein